MSSIAYYFRVNQLAKAGYNLDNKVNWWFNELLCVAVHDLVVRNNYTEFINNRLIGSALHGWVFFSVNERCNQDILDSVFQIHFPQLQKQLPKGKL